MKERFALAAIAVTVLTVGPTSYSGAAASTGPPATVQQFGPPTEGYEATNWNLDCYGYEAARRTAPIRMGGTEYLQGFQLSTSSVCSGTWTWTWHLAGRYSGLAGCVGLAGGDTQPATLSFVGPKGNPMLFQADGQQVYMTTLVAGLPTFVTLETAHLMNIIIRTGTRGATIGFGNDALYLGGITARECE